MLQVLPLRRSSSDHGVDPTSPTSLGSSTDGCKIQLVCLSFHRNSLGKNTRRVCEFGARVTSDSMVSNRLYIAFLGGLRRRSSLHLWQSKLKTRPVLPFPNLQQWLVPTLPSAMDLNRRRQAVTTVLEAVILAVSGRCHHITPRLKGTSQSIQLQASHSNNREKLQWRGSNSYIFSSVYNTVYSSVTSFFYKFAECGVDLCAVILQVVVWKLPGKSSIVDG